jgi:hypothetical protein
MMMRPMPPQVRDIEAYNALLSRSLALKKASIHEEYARVARMKGQAYQEFSRLKSNHFHKERYRRIWQNYEARAKELEADLAQLNGATRALIKISDERQNIYSAQNQIRRALGIIQTIKKTGHMPDNQSTQNLELKLQTIYQLKDKCTQTICDTMQSIKKVKRRYFDIEEIQKR